VATRKASTEDARQKWGADFISALGKAVASWARATALRNHNRSVVQRRQYKSSAKARIADVACRESMGGGVW